MSSVLVVGLRVKIVLCFCKWVQGENVSSVFVGGLRVKNYRLFLLAGSG